MSDIKTSNTKKIKRSLSWLVVLCVFFVIFFLIKTAQTSSKNEITRKCLNESCPPESIDKQDPEPSLTVNQKKKDKIKEDKKRRDKRNKTTSSLSSAEKKKASSDSWFRKWVPIVEPEGRFNSDRSIAYPKLLIPLTQSNNSMLFTDLRTRVDSNNSQEYNVGLGYRKIVGEWILGGYGFVDRLYSANNKSYWQGTVGLEALSENWDFRINGYLPQATKHVNGRSGTSVGHTLTIGGGGDFGLTTTTVTSTPGIERALAGFDTEVGYRLPINAVDLRVFGGMYHFQAKGVKSVNGPKARFELTLGHSNFKFIPEGVEFTAGAQYQNDGPREDTTTALAQVRIPFGFSSDESPRPKLSRLEKRMTNFIERDVDIVTQANDPSLAVKVEDEAAIFNDIGGRSYSKGVMIDNSEADIQGSINGIGSDSIILMNGDIDFAGKVASGTDLTLLSGQALVGASGNTFNITGVDSGQNVNFTFSGTKSRFGMANNTINLANDATLKGFDIVHNTGTRDFSIETIGSNTKNILIENVNANSKTHSFNNDGAEIFIGINGNNSDVTFKNTTVANYGGGMIEITTNAITSGITIEGTNTLTNGNVYATMASTNPDQPHTLNIGGTGTIIMRNIQQEALSVAKARLSTIDINKSNSSINMMLTNTNASSRCESEDVMLSPSSSESNISLGVTGSIIRRCVFLY